MFQKKMRGTNQRDRNCEWCSQGMRLWLSELGMLRPQIWLHPMQTEAVPETEQTPWPWPIYIYMDETNMYRV